MPNYDYVCENCGLEWEDFTTIAERHNPPNPPDCETFINGQGHCKPQLKLNTPAFAAGYGLTSRRPDESYKDILRDQKRFYDKADAAKEARGIPHKKNTLGSML